MAKNQSTTNKFAFSFGDDFLKHHAGQIVTDQNFAIIELVANSWDAGSTNINIKWPEDGGILSIEDNGIGMTKSELMYRWGKFNYNRIIEQNGNEVIFPKNTIHGKRNVFGRNGVGRHAMFCFSNEYELITKKMENIRI
ncbi:MAG: ATP-binding protein [Saprospiraceae bacterium]|nr:ATP-binding protein [Saprospiraceae bacterium]